jgi:hypothetical protein
MVSGFCGLTPAYGKGLTICPKKHQKNTGKGQKGFVVYGLYMGVKG